jgi:hypothetical protein
MRAVVIGVEFRLKRGSDYRSPSVHSASGSGI